MLSVPAGMTFFFFLRLLKGGLISAHSCIASNTLRNVEHDVLGPGGTVYNTCEETTVVHLHHAEGS